MISHRYYGGELTHADQSNRVQILQEVLPMFMKEHGADAVIVTGLSGMSVAFGALAVLNFNLFVVRKDDDGSHGESIEGPQGVRVSKYIVLDDFVSSGSTIRRIHEVVKRVCETKGLKVPEMAAILTHGNSPVWGRGMSGTASTVTTSLFTHQCSVCENTTRSTCMREMFRGVPIPDWLTLPVLREMAGYIRHHDSLDCHGFLCNAVGDISDNSVHKARDWEKFLGGLGISTGLNAFLPERLEATKMEDLLEPHILRSTFTSVAKIVSNRRRLVFLNRIAEALCE